MIWNQRHLLHALREHRPHQGIANARPLYPLPPSITDPDQVAGPKIRRHQCLGGTLHEYEHAA
jgi:putative transposase